MKNLPESLIPKKSSVIMKDYLATSAKTRPSSVKCGTMLGVMYSLVFEELKIQRLEIFGSGKKREIFYKMKKAQTIWEKFCVNSVDKIVAS